MRIHFIDSLRRALRHRNTIFWDELLLVASMAVSAMIAYEYGIFANSPGVSMQVHVIELVSLVDSTGEVTGAEEALYRG